MTGPLWGEADQRHMINVQNSINSCFGIYAVFVFISH